MESATKAAAGGLSALGGVEVSAMGTGTVQQVEKAAKGLGNLLKGK
jgi:hypothetical protein